MAVHHALQGDLAARRRRAGYQRGGDDAVGDNRVLAGIEPFDAGVFETLFKAEDETEQALRDTLLLRKQAKEAKDNAQSERLKQQVRTLQQRRSEIRRQIKTATEQNAVYYRAARPYLDAQRKLTQIDNYNHLDEIIALYPDAKARLEQKQAAKTVTV